MYFEPAKTCVPRCKYVAPALNTRHIFTLARISSWIRIYDYGIWRVHCRSRNILTKYYYEAGINVDV